jgi:hypothetical protein
MFSLGWGPSPREHEKVRGACNQGARELGLSGCDET